MNVFGIFIPVIFMTEDAHLGYLGRCDGIFIPIIFYDRRCLFRIFRFLFWNIYSCKFYYITMRLSGNRDILLRRISVLLFDPEIILCLK